MTDTSRGEAWINNFSQPTREDAEDILSMKGENPYSSFWSQALNNLYPEETDRDRETEANDIENSEQQAEADRLLYEERERVDQEQAQEQSTEGRVSKFVRGLLRGLFGDT